MARPPKITDEAILAAARTVFLEQGIGASTLAIAELAGISEASIFKRFATKQALFLAAMGISEEPEWAEVLVHQVPTVNIKAELTLLCGQMLAFYQEFMPRVLMMMTQGKLPHMPKMLPPPIRHRRLLAEFLERAMEQGYLRSGDSMTIATMMIGTMTNYVMAQTMMKRLPPGAPVLPIPNLGPDALVHNLIETLWAGIAPEA